MLTSNYLTCADERACMSASEMAVAILLVLICSALSWLFARQRAAAELAKLAAQMQQQDHRISELVAEQEQHSIAREKLQQDNRDLHILKGKLETLLSNEKRRAEEKEELLRKGLLKQQDEQEARFSAEKQVRELKVRLEEQQLQNEKSLRQLEDNKQALKEEFGNLANEILEAKSQSVSQQHQAGLENLLKPFKEQLGEFRNKVEEARKADNEGRAALKQQLETLHNLNQKITNEAGNLARALKGDKKLQGNWGELQVAKILESSGLIRGQEFEREANFKDEEG